MAMQGNLKSKANSAKYLIYKRLKPLVDELNRVLVEAETITEAGRFDYSQYVLTGDKWDYNVMTVDNQKLMIQKKNEFMSALAIFIEKHLLPKHVISDDAVTTILKNMHFKHICPWLDPSVNHWDEEAKMTSRSKMLAEISKIDSSKVSSKKKRMIFMEGLIRTGAYTKKEIIAVMSKHFPNLSILTLQSDLNQSIRPGHKKSPLPSGVTTRINFDGRLSLCDKVYDPTPVAERRKKDKEKIEKKWKRDIEQGVRRELMKEVLRDLAEEGYNVPTQNKIRSGSGDGGPEGKIVYQINVPTFDNENPNCKPVKIGADFDIDLASMSSIAQSTAKTIQMVVDSRLEAALRDMGLDNPEDLNREAQARGTAVSYMSLELPAVVHKLLIEYSLRDGMDAEDCMLLLICEYIRQRQLAHRTISYCEPHVTDAFYDDE